MQALGTPITPDPYLGNTHGKCLVCGMQIINGVQHRKWCHHPKPKKEKV
jgi:hypothetical protein